MVSRTLFALLACCPLLLSLNAGCSAAPEAAVSSRQADTDQTAGTAGAPCDPSDATDSPCAPHFYCAPATDGSCGAQGTCVASPQACPMMDVPVCGCDGNRYLNSCWATIGQPGQPGTTSAFRLLATPTMDALEGRWSRTTVTDTLATVETLVLRSNMSYRLTEQTWCFSWDGCGDATTDAESEGTFTLGTYGPIFAPTRARNAAGLATELLLQNGCPAGGFVLQGIEPPVTGTAVYLTKE